MSGWAAPHPQGYIEYPPGNWNTDSLFQVPGTERKELAEKQLAIFFYLLILILQYDAILFSSVLSIFYFLEKSKVCKYSHCLYIILIVLHYIEL